LKRLIAFLLTSVLIALSQQSSTPSTAQSTQTPAPETKKPKTSKPGTKKEPNEDTAKAQAAEKKGEAGAKRTEATKPSDPLISTSTYEGLKLRAIGPAVISGRIVAIAVNPKNRGQYYVAAASGGVWKTENDGTTWSPVFEHEGSYSIGDVKLDPRDPSVVWVGTGESNSQRSVGYGDGVYKSEDGGKSWKNLGLQHSEHIGRIAIHPKDSNTVYVAAEGPLWSGGGDRGLYKTADGGKTWNKVLNISEHTGVADVAIDPDDPDTVYAAAYQRERRVWTLIDGGPESAIYKSTDGGKSWNKLKSGLPTVDMGRIGLAISPTDSSVIYATIEAADEKGGIFRSRDHGATWEKRNNFDQGAMYYGQIIADPKNVDRIYVMNVLIRVSNDGGKTLALLGEKNKHVDNHVIWIDPNDTNYYLVGCDGGVYESYDRGATWLYKDNLPIAQFYDVAVDSTAPFYYVYGGTQDNNSVGGPSRTKNIAGITNADWFITQGGDGFRSQVDPEDPNTVYAEYQYGNLTRYDRRSGERVGIQPQPGGDNVPLRWNWDSPILVSPHNHTRLYFAANKLFRSEDRGDSWKLISGDLTRQIDRDKLPVMGKIWGPDAVAKNQSTSFYGNIVALSESPKKEGLIYAGTDDGLIQITNDSGGNWKRYEKFPGVPDMTYVSRLLASQHDANLVYASFDNHKNGDFKPYLLKSNNGGESWASIAANLPANGPVLAIAEDFVNPNLLFVGTEFGLFGSVNGGGTWTQLKGNMPTIPVRDIVIQKPMNDLVIATFGRGFYVLDDLTPLRAMSTAIAGQAGAVFPVRDSLLYIQERPLGGRRSGQGEAYYAADNSPFGTTFTYYLKEKFKNKKELRQDREKAANRETISNDAKTDAKTKGKTAEKEKSANAPAPPPYPTPDELRAEAEEEAPAVYLTVSDASGKPVRRITATNAPGMNRASWDLRYPASELRTGPNFFEDDEEASPESGELVLPGKYTVTLSKKVDGQWTDLSQPVAFNVVVEGGKLMNEQDRVALETFQQKLANLNRGLAGAIGTSNDINSRLTQIKRALRETPGDVRSLMTAADQIQKRNGEILRLLRGDRILQARNYNVPVSINDRVNQIIAEERFSTQRPPRTHVDSYNVAAQQFGEQLNALRNLVQTDLKSLEDGMEKAGSPWTPGRLPQWSEH
jgi:photosystem II stability/assembly factor-like uncharacterized protein